MTNATVTLVDVRRVQDYLFNANELKQNLGASALVEQATQEWIIQSLPARRNARWDAEKYEIVFNDQTLESGQLDAEVIYVGGGNAAILFSTHQEAVNFTQRYTDALLIGAPGLETAVAHVQDADLSASGSLKGAWRKLQQEEMPPRKEGRLVPLPILGLAVTAECAYTGLPAVEEVIEDDNVGTLLSAESYVKQDDTTVEQANKRLNTLLKIDGFDYPLRFEDLGGERGSSRFVAVVHIDGNSMGKRIEAHVEDDDNREMIRRMREFSQTLNRVGLNAIQTVRDHLAIRTVPANNDRKLNEIVDCYDPNETIRLKDTYLPIRPLVFGGDDITFVCEGRLGLVLAEKVLEALSKAELPDKQTVYACAGVAIVHSHYPFARAYALAGELCDAAKQKAREWDKDQSRVSLLNWHIATAGLTLDWDEIKKREYQNGNLLMRPLVVAKEPNVSTPAWQTWQTFINQIRDFRKDWKDQRNKQKELLQTLRKGSGPTLKFTGLHGSLPTISEALPVKDTHKSGWLIKDPNKGVREDQCLYFDALEAMDFFIYPEDTAHE